MSDHAKIKARRKRQIVRILSELPSDRWLAELAKISETPLDRATIFQVMCAMEQSGELDELKARNRCSDYRLGKLFLRKTNNQ